MEHIIIIHTLCFQGRQMLYSIFLRHVGMEIVNPLGTHVKKNKHALLYYSLANIAPQFCSKLSTNQLLAVARSTKVGALVKAPVWSWKTLSILWPHCQWIATYRCQVTDRLFRALGVWDIDNSCLWHTTVAAQWLRECKEGVWFAFKPFRTC